LTISPASVSFDHDFAVLGADEVEGSRVEERRIIFAGLGLANRRNSQIVEHELDMVRSAERPIAGVPTLTRIRNWLMPSGRLVGPPMRSVARELEEAFPSRDIQV
jgi:hypothetical protein